METRLTGKTDNRKNQRSPLSPVIKHSIHLAGKKTSVTLEKSFWDGLHEIAVSEGTTKSELIERINTNRTVHNLSSCIRIFVLNHFRSRPRIASEISAETRQHLAAPA